MHYINLFIAMIARNAKRLIVTASVIVVLALCASAAYDYGFTFVRGDDNEVYDENGEKVTLTIPKGATSKDVAQILQDNGVIKSAKVFALRAKLTGAENSFKFGTYTFVIGMHDKDIFEVLKEGNKVEGIRITIPEGWTCEQIGAYLQEKDICLKKDFLAACDRLDYDFDYYTKKMKKGTADRRYLLEGYLFPDTYEINAQDTPDQIVSRLLRQFEIEFDGDLKARAKELGLRADQVITMASVIEKEAKLDEDRPKIAAVLYNRMELGMPWQLNSTVLYALGKESDGEDNLTYDDLEIESGYNTYKYAGYPTGPICCPGRASIEAVLYPADIDALYFILDNEETGSHLFTSSYDEFLAAKGSGN